MYSMLIRRDSLLGPMNIKRRNSKLVRTVSAIGAVVLASSFPVASWAAGGASELSDVALPMQLDLVPGRTKPILEIGDTFLGPGNIAPGFTLPTGAVWQPSLLVWGSFRTALNHIDDEVKTGDDHLSEWANRLDLFGQVSLSQADRIVVGVRTFDEDSGFFGRRFHPESETIDPELDISVAFLEVNLAELFPGSTTEAGQSQRRNLDLDLSIGRQPIQFQGGTIINDLMDAVAITRNNIALLPGATNTRASFVYAWNSINRGAFGANDKDDEASLYALFTESDFSISTVAFDVVVVESDETGDGIYAGLSAVQRLGKFNTAFRIVHSEPTDGSTVETTRGTLLVSEASISPAYTTNNLYANFFWAEDEFNSASRDFGTGGPLGLVGILYAGVGLGSYSAPLGNNARDSYGGALGYQMFSANQRRQLILELGARTDTDSSDRTQYAGGARFQQAMGKHLVFRVDGYLQKLENFSSGWGARTELLVKF